jgi:hypothetical protein
VRKCGFALAGLVGLSGCTDGGDRRPSPAEPGEAPLAEAEAPEPSEAPLQIELVAVAAVHTDTDRIRWSGLARVTGERDTEQHVLVKTTCLVDGRPLTEVTYASVDRGTSNMGRPGSGAAVSFSATAGGLRPLDVGACEMRILLLDHATARLSRTVSTPACFVDGAAYVGPCQPRIERYPPGFDITAFAVREPFRHGLPGEDVHGAWGLDFTMAIGERMSAGESLVVKARCRQAQDAPFPGILIATARSIRSWSLLAPGEAARDSSTLPEAVLANADACALWFRRVALDYDDPGVVRTELIEEIADRCWTRRGTNPAACSLLGEHPDRVVWETVSLAGTAIVDDDPVAAVVVHDPVAFSGSLQAEIECARGLVPTVWGVDTSALASELDPGDTIVARVRTSRRMTRHCRIRFLHEGKPFGEACMQGRDLTACPPVPD